jgi:hypothetical protein
MDINKKLSNLAWQGLKLTKSLIIKVIKNALKKG